jgi:hypothetical protein
MLQDFLLLSCKPEVLISKTKLNKAASEMRVNVRRVEVLT